MNRPDEMTFSVLNRHRVIVAAALSLLRRLAMVVTVGTMTGWLCQPVAYAETPSVVGSLVIKLIDQVEVPALEPGALKTVEVRVGDVIKAGQLVALVDDRDSRSKRDLAEIELDVSRKRSDEFRGNELAKANLDEKRAAVEQQKLLAKISLETSTNEVRVSAAAKAEAVAKNEWTRAHKARLAFADSVSDSEIDNLRLKFDQSTLERMQAAFEQRMDQLASASETEAVKISQSALERAVIDQKVALADADVLEMDVQAKRSTLESHQLNVERHRVVSPIDGVVVEVYKRSGEWVRPGDSVVRIINVDHLHAEGFLSGNVRPARGRKVILHANGNSTDGVIDFVSPERDSVSGEFRFLVRLDGGAFFPGDRVEIDW